jgi:hypothetical protein
MQLSISITLQADQFTSDTIRHPLTICNYPCLLHCKQTKSHHTLVSEFSLTTYSCSAAAAACEWNKANGNAKACDCCISMKKKCFFAGPGDQGEETSLTSLQALKNEMKLGFNRASKESTAVIQTSQDLLDESKLARADRKEALIYLQALACARRHVEGEKDETTTLNAGQFETENGLSAQPEEERSMDEDIDRFRYEAQVVVVTWSKGSHCLSVTIMLFLKKR